MKNEDWCGKGCLAPEALGKNLEDQLDADDWRNQIHQNSLGGFFRSSARSRRPKRNSGKALSTDQ
jgi:hypothetical protein